MTPTRGVTTYMTHIKCSDTPCGCHGCVSMAVSQWLCLNGCVSIEDERTAKTVAMMFDRALRNPQ